jgi:hypothetical protein
MPPINAALHSKAKIHRNDFNDGREARFPVIKQKPPAIPNWQSNPTIEIVTIEGEDTNALITFAF